MFRESDTSLITLKFLFLTAFLEHFHRDELNTTQNFPRMKHRSIRESSWKCFKDNYKLYFTILSIYTIRAVQLKEKAYPVFNN